MSTATSNPAAASADEVSPPAAPPVSARVCDWTVGILAVWTLACHAAVVLGGNLYHVLFAFVVFGAAALGLRFAVTDRSLEAEPAAVVTPPAWWPKAAGFRDKPWAYPAFCAVALLAVGSGAWDSYLFSTILSYWWASVLVLGLAFVFFGLDERPDTPGADVNPPFREPLLWALAAALAVSGLFVHYVERDDTFYISMAARAADSPSTPIMTQDPMHGVAGMPVPNPAHVVSSHELFGGAISLITGIEPVYVFHWLLAFAGMLLAPLALARLLRVLAPQWWWWAVLATLVILVATGDAHRWYGNFLVTKMWFGKSYMLMITVPLTAYYALAFAQRPTLWRWLALAAAQTAGLGLSSSAIFVLPVVATLTALAVIPLDKPGLIRLLQVMGSSAYVLAAALWLRARMAFLKDYVSAATQGQADFGTYPRHEALGDWTATSIVQMFGEGLLLPVGLLSLSLCWMLFPRHGMLRRFLILLPLGVFVTLLNPYLERLIVAYVTASAHWRLMWILPVPAMMALVMLSPAQFGRRGLAIAAVLLLLYVRWVPMKTSLSPDNLVMIHAPSAKTGPSIMEAAVALNERVPPGSHVIAWHRVSNLMPQLRNCAYPVVPRVHYLHYIAEFRNLFDADERDRRIRIHYLTNLVPPEYLGDERMVRLVETEFARALTHYDVTGICLYKFTPFLPHLERAAEQTGFQRNWENDDFVIWIREAV